MPRPSSSDAKGYGRRRPQPVLRSRQLRRVDRQLRRVDSVTAEGGEAAGRLHSAGAIGTKIEPGFAVNNRYYDLNSYLRNIFGCRVQKISLDAGLTCPNGDGVISREGCIYFNLRGSGTGAHSKGLSVTEQIVKGKEFLRKRYKAERFIAYFQSFTNTYGPLEKLIVSRSPSAGQ